MIGLRVQPDDRAAEYTYNDEAASTAIMMELRSTAIMIQ